MPLFTKEELEALRLADAELDEEFRERPEEIAARRRAKRQVSHNTRQPTPYPTKEETT